MENLDMPKRDDWIEIVIIGAVAGIASSCLILAIRLGASIDNALNFFGGAVGSGLAVVASLWLESRKREKGLDRLYKSLVLTTSASLRFQLVQPQYIVPMIVTYTQAVDAFEAMRVGVPLEDPLHQYAFQSAYFWINYSASEMKAIIGEIREGRKSLEDAHERCLQLAAAIHGPVRTFLGMDGIPKEHGQTLEKHLALTEDEKG